jgi:hypothetical protein
MVFDYKLVNLQLKFPGIIMRVIVVCCLLLICSDSIGQCILKNFNVISLPCDQRGTFYVKLDFEYTATSKKFLLTGNGKNYGYFEYGSLPLTIGPLKADCNTPYEFAVTDSTATSCVLYKNIGKSCCTDFCKIRINKTDVSSCNDFQYDIKFDLLSVASGNLFDLYYDDKKVSSFTKSGLTQQVKQLKTSFINTFHTVSVCAANDQKCCDTVTISNPCICNITKVRTDVIDCDTQKKSFNVMINFDHKAASDSFRIGGNSTNYGTFAYRDLPVTVRNLQMHHNRNYEFLIIDKADPFCFGSNVLGVVDTCKYNCEISNVKIAPLFCNDSSVIVGLGLKAFFPGVSGFKVDVDGKPVGQFQYGEKEYLLNLPKKLCGQQFAIKMVDNLKSLCATSLFFKSDTCCVIPCSISDIKFSEKCNDEGLQYLNLSFEHKGTSDSFSVSVNDTLLIRESYKFLPVKLYLRNLDNQEIKVSIRDLQNNECAAQTLYKTQCVKKPPCKINNFSVKASGCDSKGSFGANFLFDVDNATSSHFTMSINGLHPDTFAYGQPQYSTKLLNGDCVTKYRFYLRDIKDSLCSATFSFPDTICCRICTVSNPEITYLPCANAKYGVKLNFEYNHNHPFFIMTISGKPDTIIRYADLPVILKDFVRGSLYLIKIRDSLSQSCALSLGTIMKDCPSSVDYIDVSPAIIFDGVKLKVDLADISAKGEMQIFDITGKMLYRTTFFGQQEVATDRWTNGLYVCRISLNQRVYNKKIYIK